MKNERDLRVIKTRTNITNAMIALLKEKPMAEISVKEICDLALCSRNTFYLHFPYKEAVLDSLIGECIDGIISGLRAAGEPLARIDAGAVGRNIRGFVHAAFEARDKITFLLEYGSSCAFAMRLTGAIYDSLVRYAEALVPGVTGDARFCGCCRYLVGGMVSIIIYWMEHPEISEDDAFSMLRGIGFAPTEIAIDYLMAQAQDARSPGENRL